MVCPGSPLFVRVRVMKTDAQVSRDVFLRHFVDGAPTKAIHFQSVFKTDDSYFYNARLGSLHSFSDDSPGFSPCTYADFTAKNVESLASAEIDLHCQIVYVNDIHFNPNNGSPYRNVVYHTDEETIFGTIWAEELFHLTENVKLYITNLKRKDYYGTLLYTTGMTMVMTSGQQCNPPLTTQQMLPFKLRATNVQNPIHKAVSCIVGCSFRSSTHCTAKGCIGQIVPTAAGGDIGTCSVAGCPKRVRLSQLKPVLTGEIDLDDVTLTVDKDAVDGTFGLGVYDRYLHQAEQLSDKFLELTDITVVYEKKSKKCLMIH